MNLDERTDPSPRPSPLRKGRGRRIGSARRNWPGSWREVSALALRAKFRRGPRVIEFFEIKMKDPDVNKIAEHYSAILSEIGADLESEGLL